MKTKRCIIIQVMNMLLIFLCACGQKSGSIVGTTATTASTSMDATSKSNNTGTTSPEPTQQNDEQENQEPQEPAPADIFRSETFSIVLGETFDSGVAWATLYDEKTNEKFKGIINTYGELIYKLNEDIIPGSDRIYTLPFSKGLSVVYEGHNRSGFVILNDTGKEIFSCTGEDIKISGITSDGKIIASKHESGFAGDDWYFCIFDSESRSLQETGIKMDSPVGLYDEDQFLLIADGLYYHTGKRKFLNLKNKSWFDVDTPILGDYRYTMIRYIAKVNEKIFFEVLNGGDHFYGYLPVDTVQSVSKTEDLWNLVNSDSFIKIYCDDADIYSIGIKEWHDGSFQIYEEKYTDLSGNTIFTFPSFPEGVKYKEIDDFSGGYAALYLIGVDKKNYVTIIDENGNIQYDPVRYDVDINTFTANIMSLNGYVFVLPNEHLETVTTEFEPVIIDPKGRSLQLGDDLSALSGAKVFGNDYMFVRSPSLHGYISLDGKTRIESINAKYNKSGHLLFTDKTGVLTFNGNAEGKTYSSEPIISDEPEKEYVFLSDFVIEGKWKNVGNSTYGQVQSGAIVIFDGAKCNVVSPQDTYAFYKNGDNWRLDCTTLLGDTLSFTVKTIDEDNIDIYYGSSCLEMVRINLGNNSSAQEKSFEKSSSGGSGSTSALSSAKVGDYITFGSYEQDGNTGNGKEPIEWIVVHKESDGSALLMSRYALDCKSYHDTYDENTRWESSTIREWLSSSFYNEAFNSEERNMILEVELNNDEYDSDEITTSKDKVFLLSLNEIKNYFPKAEGEQTDFNRPFYSELLWCAPTQYARTKGAIPEWAEGEQYCQWFLRATYGGHVLFAKDNAVWVDENPATMSEAIRPAIWIRSGSDQGN